MASRRIWEPRRQQLRALLRAVRIDAGLTQVELAAQLEGRPQSYISKSENGERRLDLVELEEICDVMQIDLVEFVRRYREIR